MRLAAALLLLVILPAQAQGVASAGAAASAFYQSMLAPGSARGIGLPDAAGRARLAPMLSARLNKALSDAAQAQARFLAKVHDAPPLIEGDIFSSLFEGPTAFSLGACRGDDRATRCTVTLLRQEPNQKPVRWTDTIILTNQGGWKVDDIAYDANFAFGNTGTLSQTLAMAMSAAP